MIRIYRKTLKDASLEVLEKPLKGSWVYVSDPSEEELTALSEEYLLEKGHLLDALDPFETPRLEIEPGGLYVYLRVPSAQGETITTAPILFISTEDHLITVSKEKRAFFEDFLNEKIDFYTTQRNKTLLFMFLKASLLYHRHLNDIIRRLRGKQNNLTDISDKDIADFVRWEGILNDFITSLVPSSNIYRALLSKQHVRFFKEDEDLIEDLLLSNDETIDMCKTSIRTISNLREGHSTLMANSLNRSIKFLTAITIILTLPTMIASIYGMNVGLPFQDNPHAFSIVFAMIIAISLIALWIFNKKHWL